MVVVRVKTPVVETAIYYRWPGVRAVGISSDGGIPVVVYPDVFAVIHVDIDVATAFIYIHFVVAEVAIFARTLFSGSYFPVVIFWLLLVSLTGSACPVGLSGCLPAAAALSCAATAASSALRRSAI
jgi:hypothetical protein